MAMLQARVLPLSDKGDAHVCEGVAAQLDCATDWDGAAQAAPAFEPDQRVNR